MSAITVRNLWKDYGNRVILERINLEIAPRSFVALVGPSGCGKTTFLRLLLSEEIPSKGEILLDGQPLSLEPGPERGVVFQRYSVFPHLTVLGNVMLGREFQTAPLTGKLVGARRRPVIVEARAVIEAVGLSDAEHKYPSELSGGMRQRLALAQALIAKPKVLLLDEPFGALDPGIKSDIHGLMRKLWHDWPITVVMVTHDLSEAFSLATRVLAFERPRDNPEDRDRYGAVITADIDVWPKRIERIAGQPACPPAAPFTSGRDDPAA